MESVKSQIFPKDLSLIMRRTLYIKFITIIVLNNLFWILLTSLNSTEITETPSRIPKNYNSLVIKTKLMTEPKANRAFAIITKNKTILSKNSMVLEKINSYEEGEELSYRYQIAVPNEDYLRVINHLSEHLNLIPLESLNYLEASPSQEPSHEIHF